jgi:hypothetical protein
VAPSMSLGGASGLLAIGGAPGELILLPS